MRLTAVTRKPNKYGARKVEFDGEKFDSKKELKRWHELQLLERAGHISNLKRQVPYVLIPDNDKFRRMKYIADFTYEDRAGAEIVEDVKGCKIGAGYELFKLKKKLMYHVWKIEVQEI